MSHVTHMNESCHTYEWVMSHIWMIHESWHIPHGHVTSMSPSDQNLLSPQNCYVHETRGTGFDDLVNTLSASCEESSTAISLSCTSSKSSVNEFFFDLWMLCCKRRCSHAYLKLANGVCLRPLPQLCRLPPLRRIQSRRRLSTGSEPKTKTPAQFLGDKTQDPWCQKRKVSIASRRNHLLRSRT